MTRPSERMAAAGLALPDVAAPVGAYVPAVCHGGLVHVTGQLAFVDGSIPVSGVLGRDVTVEDGVRAARAAALNSVAAAASVVGGVDDLSGVVEVVAFVACEPGFDSMSSVVDGASTLFPEVFGDSGRHVRSSVGAAWLPLGSPVEVRVTFTRSISEGEGEAWFR